MNKKQFLISVVIPVYNVEGYLKETIESIIKQTIGFKDNIEIILVNDGSTDNSEEICLYYKEMYPDNVKYKKQKNQGVSAARNNGFKLATGKYVNFMDSDDKWEKNAFELGIKMFEKYPEIPFVSYRVKFFDSKKGYHILDDKFKKGIDIVDTSINEDCFQTFISTLLFKKEYIKGYKFDENLPYAEDVKYVNSIMLNHSKYGLIRNSHFFYRKRQDKSSATQSGFLKKSYYDSLSQSYLYIYNEAKKKLGKFPRYLQYLTMYELQWRLKNNIQAQLTEQEKDEYIGVVCTLLQNIDDDIILKQKNLTVYYKLLALKIKYGEEYNSKINVKDEKLYINDTEIALCKKIRNIVDHFEIDKDSIRIDGYVFEPKDNIKLYYKINDSDLVELELYDRTSKNKRFADKIIIKAQGYTLELPIKNINKIEFYIEIDGTKHKMNNFYIGYSALTNVKYNYYDNNGYIITKNKVANRIIIKKKTLKRKIYYELRYLYHLIKTKNISQSVMRIVYYVTKPFFSKNIYIFSDREFMARDSGELLFKYFNHKKPKNVKSYFAINNKNDDYKRIKKEGKVLKYGTLKYQLFFLNAKYIISSHADNYVTNAFRNNQKYFVDLYKFKYIYLTHGILLHNSSSWLNRIGRNIALNVVTSPSEYDSIIQGEYFFKENELLKTGMPRYDNLMNNDEEIQNKILFMPSWRSKLVGPTISGTQRREYNPNFKESEYFKFYDKLFNDKRLHKILKEYNLKIKFCIHPSFRAQQNDFKGNEYVEVAIDVDSQYETKTSKFIVTDYSSSACDFAYLRKPVIYANFDYDHIYDIHYYNKGYFDYDIDGFGPNCKTYDEVLENIIKTIKNNCNMEDKYLKRCDKFFYFHDNKNSERVYNEIIKYDKSR